MKNRFTITPVLLVVNRQDKLVTKRGTPLTNVTLDGLVPYCMEFLRDGKQDEVAHVEVEYNGLRHPLADKLAVQHYLEHARAGTLSQFV